MRATINHGKRGTKIDRLLKEYEMTYPQDYYDYIIQSYEYGHKDQVISLFNRMKGEQQKSFLIEVNHMGYIHGERLQDFIISNL